MPRPQFSLKTMLAATTLAAVFTWLTTLGSVGWVLTLALLIVTVFVCLSR